MYGHWMMLIRNNATQLTFQVGITNFLQLRYMAVCEITCILTGTPDPAKPWLQRAGVLTTSEGCELTGKQTSFVTPWFSTEPWVFTLCSHIAEKKVCASQ